MKWSKNEIDFLIENYPKYGGKYCQPYLKNRKIGAINAYARGLGIRADNKQVHPDLQNISINQFVNIDKKEVAYFLGYLWADGYIHNYICNKTNHYRICIEINSEDANNVKDIFFTLGNWNLQKRKRKKTWKESTLFTTNNKDLYHYLFNHDYNTKSESEPALILNKIPKNLHNYFWKGYIDGDGSIGLSGRGAYFEIASTYDYEYSELIDLVQKLGITKYNIYKQISKKGHKSSVFKIYGKEILKLGKLFVPLGLKRKINKFFLIKQKYTK